MSTSTTVASGPNLTPAQRALLLGLIEADPLGTCRGIAARFERLTGRSITVPTVSRAWRLGYRDPADSPYGPLSEAQRATLARICREEAYNRRRAVRRFEAETGRRLGRETVRKFIRKHLGVTAPAPNGRPPGRGVTA